MDVFVCFLLLFCKFVERPFADLISDFYCVLLHKILKTKIFFCAFLFYFKTFHNQFINVAIVPALRLKLFFQRLSALGFKINSRYAQYTSNSLFIFFFAAFKDWTQHNVKIKKKKKTQQEISLYTKYFYRSSPLLLVWYSFWPENASSNVKKPKRNEQINNNKMPQTNRHFMTTMYKFKNVFLPYHTIIKTKFTECKLISLCMNIYLRIKKNRFFFSAHVCESICVTNHSQNSLNYIFFCI